jgi:hypothetical protein
MAERVRLIIDTTEEIRLAVRLASVQAGVSMSEVVEDLIRTGLPAAVKDARKYAPASRTDSPDRSS